MTWREIVAERQSMGRFTGAERVRWSNSETCPVGEGIAELGLDAYAPAWHAAWHQVDGDRPPHFSGLSARFLVALHLNDFAEADRLLDVRDDRVLALKREVRT